MKRIWIAGLAVLLSVGARAASTETHAGRVPVLLELFTSEGCSSCPPADRLLETLDKDQPIAGADLIVLSEHVDYWNHLGWSDPFSSAQFSARQRDYAAHLHADDVYTPQLVIDGQAELVGSERAKVVSAIERRARETKLELSIQSSNNRSLHIEAPAAKNGTGKLDVYVALASDHAQSQVAKGENAGRSLRHVAVVYDLRKAGSWDTSSALTRDLAIRQNGENTRAIVFLQDPHTARIEGVAETRLFSR